MNHQEREREQEPGVRSSIRDVLMLAGTLVVLGAETVDDGRDVVVLGFR